MSIDRFVAHEQPGRRWKLCGGSPHAPGQRDAEQRAGGRQGHLVDVGELVAEGEERHRADAHHARGETVSPSTKFTALMVATTMKPVSNAPCAGVEGVLRPVATGHVDVLDAEGDEEPAASTWPPSLVSASSSERSSSTPTRADQCTGDEHDAGVAEDEGSAVGEEGQLARHDVRRHQSAEHRQPAEVGIGTAWTSLSRTFATAPVRSAISRAMTVSR